MHIIDAQYKGETHVPPAAYVFLFTTKNGVKYRTRVLGAMWLWAPEDGGGRNHQNKSNLAFNLRRPDPCPPTPDGAGGEGSRSRRRARAEAREARTGRLPEYRSPYTVGKARLHETSHMRDGCAGSVAGDAKMKVKLTRDTVSVIEHQIQRGHSAQGRRDHLEDEFLLILYPRLHIYEVWVTY